MRSYFPKALLYKEWIQQRWWLLLAFLLIAFIPVSSGLQFLFDLAGHADSRAALLAGSISFNPFDIEALASYVIVGIAVASVCLERGRGSLWFTLAGPVRRNDLLRVKFFIGWVSAMGIFMLLALFFICIGIIETLTIGVDAISNGAILQWLGKEVILQSAMYSAAFASATAIGNIIAAAIGGLALAGFPAFLSTLVKIIRQNMYPFQGIADSRFYLIDHVEKLLIAMSPLTYINPMSPVTINYQNQFGDMTVSVIWFGIWSVAFYFIAQRLFQRSAAENFSNLFIFPVVWKWVLFGICCLIGILFTSFLQSKSGRPIQNPIVFLLLFIVSAGVLWYVATRMIDSFLKKSIVRELTD